MTKRLNLDQEAAIHAQAMVDKGIALKDAKSDEAKAAKGVENLVTKTLGVLQEQGVYAMFLFLFSRSSNEARIAPGLRAPLYSLLRRLPHLPEKEQLARFDEATEAKTVLSYVANSVCQDLDTLLLVKELCEQTLIYARYGAKAAGKE